MTAWTPAEVERMNALYDGGMGLREIATVLGRTYRAVQGMRVRTRSSNPHGRFIPEEHRRWYEKLRRIHSPAYARAELQKVMAQ